MHWHYESENVCDRMWTECKVSHLILHAWLDLPALSLEHLHCLYMYILKQYWTVFNYLCLFVLQICLKKTWKVKPVWKCLKPVFPLIASRHVSSDWKKMPGCIDVYGEMTSVNEFLGSLWCHSLISRLTLCLVYKLSSLLEWNRSVQCRKKVFDPFLFLSFFNISKSGMLQNIKLILILDKCNQSK